MGKPTPLPGIAAPDVAYKNRHRGNAMKLILATAAFVSAVMSFAAIAADYPAPRQDDWIARDFKFHTGEVLPELKLAYTLSLIHI